MILIDKIWLFNKHCFSPGDMTAPRANQQAYVSVVLCMNIKEMLTRWSTITVCYGKCSHSPHRSRWNPVL